MLKLCLSMPPVAELTGDGTFGERAMRELEIAEEAAATAGAIIARYFRDGVSVGAKVEAEEKQTYNLITAADLESEQAIVDAIRAAFPGDQVLGEEATQADLSAPRLWIVDPLDGTNNFAHGIPHFAVSIAFLEDGEPQCGIIFDPIGERWFVSQRGCGSTINGKPTRVADHQHLTESLVGVGFYYDRGRMMEATLAAIGELFRNKVHGIRRFGTASLDLCHVGLGWFGAYFEYNLAAWDFAAGQLFVTEAGGQISDCQGNPMPIGSSSILATNGTLHEPMLEIVRPLDPQMNG